MDGVRAYWDGFKLVSKNGKKIHCPHWFIEGLPKDITLDGELWMGQGTTVEDIQKAIHSKDSDWSNVGYYVFDLPSSGGTYECRINEMDRIGGSFPLHVQIVKSIQCTGNKHLEEYFNSIMEANGEGVIARRPNTMYEKGLTTSLLKVKV